MTRQGIAVRMAKWGRAADVYLDPYRCPHTHPTHSIRRGIDVFTLEAAWRHSSSVPTGHFVASIRRDSSSLGLG